MSRVRCLDETSDFNILRGTTVRNLIMLNTFSEKGPLISRLSVVWLAGVSYRGYFLSVGGL